MNAFKQELLNEIKIIVSQKPNTPTRQWLKSHEVRRLLTISPGTLQHLRVNGTLPFSKIGGVIYYDHDDIQKMLNQSKRVEQRSPFSLEKRSASNKSKLGN